ncbi:MAG: tyrosine-type recombinase/integrase [Candidatus Peregrinibacteria bacterium]|nr:tyrosine-type recombinase/integrase [Candidatus Peregrinibacteria bacterium]
MSTFLLPTPAVSSPSITDYVHPFLVQQDSDGTRREYQSEIRLFGAWIGKPLGHVTPLEIIAYRKHLEERGLKAATIRKKLAILRSFYGFISQAFGLPNPALCVRLPKATDQSIKAVLSLQEVGRLLSVIDMDTPLGKRDLAMLGLLLVNGLRSIEVSRANFGDMREIEGMIALRVRGKGGRIEDTRLREDVHRAIQSYLATRQEVEPDEPLFRSVGNLASEEGRMSPKTVQARVRYLYRLAKLEKPMLSPHSLRATCAVLTISIGKADLLQVQRLLRHRSPSTTLVYVQALDSLRESAVSRNPISLDGLL